MVTDVLLGAGGCGMHEVGGMRDACEGASISFLGNAFEVGPHG